MDRVSIAPPAGPSAHGEQAALATAGPRRGRLLLVTAALLLPLIGVATLVVFVFQPFANAAGGCGGG